MKSDNNRPTTQDSGPCGKNMTWMFLHEENKLVISGKGRMTAYPAMDLVPWTRFRPCIRQICIGEDITDLCDYAFANCHILTAVVLGKDISAIGKLAFYDCNSLVSIHIPAMTKSIGNSAFSMCRKLENISVDKRNTNYCSENGILFNKTQTTLIRYPEGKKETEYTVPDSVRIIGTEAFTKCRLQSVILPHDITEIEDYAFIHCRNLESVCLPDGIHNIGRNAFLFCDKLHQKPAGRP